MTVRGRGALGRAGPDGTQLRQDREPGQARARARLQAVSGARMAVGYSSQQAPADRLGFDRSAVGKAESGDRPPTPEVLRPWCAACNLDYDHFARLAALARRADGPVESWFVEWIEKELAARVIRAWSPVLLPGLLQTGGYARALFLAAGADDDYADEQVSVRLGRQEILERPRPPHVIAVIDESVLHRLIGSPQVMHDALVRVRNCLSGRTSWSRWYRPLRGQTRGSAERLTWPQQQTVVLRCGWTA
jgi:transcriptional regulator with XRE-family HTH domain